MVVLGSRLTPRLRDRRFSRRRGRTGAGRERDRSSRRADSLRVVRPDGAEGIEREDVDVVDRAEQDCAAREDRISVWIRDNLDGRGSLREPTNSRLTGIEIQNVGRRKSAAR